MAGHKFISYNPDASTKSRAKAQKLAIEKPHDEQQISPENQVRISSDPQIEMPEKSLVEWPDLGNEVRPSAEQQTTIPEKSLFEWYGPGSFLPGWTDLENGATCSQTFGFDYNMDSLNPDGGVDFSFDPDFYLSIPSLYNGIPSTLESCDTALHDPAHHSGMTPIESSNANLHRSPTPILRDAAIEACDIAYVSENERSGGDSTSITDGSPDVSTLDAGASQHDTPGSSANLSDADQASDEDYDDDDQLCSSPSRFRFRPSTLLDENNTGSYQRQVGHVYDARRDREFHSILGKEHINGEVHYLVDWVPTIVRCKMLQGACADEIIGRFEKQYKKIKEDEDSLKKAGEKKRGRSEEGGVEETATPPKRQRGRPRKVIVHVE